jgi:hypothetical protein
MRNIASIGAAVALSLALTPSARADEHDRLTHMTFSGTVQVPGVTLAPGTYTFRIADTRGDRHIVQIFTKDDNKLITTAMTIPSERVEPTDGTLVTFAERSAGAPQAVKEWFYPGGTVGEEFLYPKQSKLMARAERNQQPPIDRDRSDSAAASQRRREASPPPSPAPSTTPSTDRQSDVSRPPPAPSASTNGDQTARGDRALPQTASPLALVELFSGLSLTMAYGLRRLRKSQ